MICLIKHLFPNQFSNRPDPKENEQPSPSLKARLFAVRYYYIIHNEATAR
ncbi:hypothetical protein HMPREF1988_00731 [Porphyromonas gingivalis F0185]|uniref:Uncharacterized protein n=1 Tax=Porphyromonas gingivalis F0570 TaxID=1227271 RepID=A0A0E2LUD5_PORGN|nr:hypothetical protein HMPREF1555_00052 [Porphyromonas gingivalis F0570]ERJ84418.1 hypothetical protein HMPREF1988_00731 [Porphyromonas gingivalis F0185]